MNLEQILERSLSLADDSDWEGVAELLREHLVEFDESPAVHCWLGVAERELGMEGVAYERFKRALELEPIDPYVLATAGNGIAAFDDPAAEQALRTAAITAPDVLIGRLLYGAYLSREGFHAEALSELRAARAIAPDDSEAAYELGVALALSGDLDGAADSLGEAVQLAQDDGWARVVFGLVLLEGGRTEEATGELIEGGRMREDDVEAQLVAALAAAATGHEGAAYEMIERARLNSVEGDFAVVAAVEERIDEGHEAAAALLMEDMAPDLLRTRLLVRP